MPGRHTISVYTMGTPSDVGSFEAAYLRIVFTSPATPHSIAGHLSRTLPRRNGQAQVLRGLNNRECEFSSENLNCLQM